MKEHPILFKAPMVKAILAGAKTQTRRVCKFDGERLSADISQAQRVCPYGQPGDRLWGRETHCFAPKHPSSETWSHTPDEARVIYAADGEIRLSGPHGMWSPKMRPSIHLPRWASRILLEVVSVRVERLNDISASDCLAEGIVVENVIVDTNCHGGSHNEVSGDRYFYDGCDDDGFEFAEDAYLGLWEKINGSGSWAANPWLWVVEFKRVQL